jgi:hypothetical protein
MHIEFYWGSVFKVALGTLMLRVENNIEIDLRATGFHIMDLTEQV